jgi:hypothetical protein
MIHVECLPRIVSFLEASKADLSFVMFPKDDVKTFKETIYMLQVYCVEDHIGSAVCLLRIVHQAYDILRLFKGRL